MPRKIVNPRIQGQSLPPEITQGPVQRMQPKAPKPRKDFADQNKVDKVYRWK